MSKLRSSEDGHPGLLWLLLLAAYIAVICFLVVILVATFIKGDIFDGSSDSRDAFTSPVPESSLVYPLDKPIEYTSGRNEKTCRFEAAVHSERVGVAVWSTNDAECEAEVLTDQGSGYIRWGSTNGVESIPRGGIVQAAFRFCNLSGSSISNKDCVTYILAEGVKEPELPLESN